MGAKMERTGKRTETCRSKSLSVVPPRSGHCQAPVSHKLGDMTRAESVSHDDRATRTAALVEQLHDIVDQLEAMHPGRRFPLDGHLVGSIGEAAAEALFAIRLAPAS